MPGGKSTRSGSKPAKSRRPAASLSRPKPEPTPKTTARAGSGSARAADALEQQAATSEILRVISRSRTDAQPVFDLIARRAGKLCGAEVAVVSRFDGTMIQLAAVHGVVPKGVRIVRGLYPMQLDARTVTARVIRSRRVVHIADVLADRRYGIKEFARAAHYRSGLGVPIVRDGTVIGSIFVGRAAPGLFTAAQVELLKTFSEQAAIAIENVRLFEELRRSEERYALATSAAVEGIYEWDVEGEKLFLTDRAKAFFSLHGAQLTPAAWNVRIHPEDYPGYRAAITDHFKRRTTHLEHEYRIADDGGGYRWVLDRGIGVRNADGRVTKVVGALSDITQRKRAEIDLRRARDEAEEALEQQTATAEILRAISSSPGNLQPVLDTLVRAAARFCGAPDVALLRLDGGVLRGAAAVGSFGDVLVRRAGSMEAIEIPVTIGSVSGRAFVERRTVQVADLAVASEADYPVGRRLQRQFGHRTCAATPLLREDQALGVIALFRTEVRPFSEKQLELLRIFADQAVIAIENVRLFNELEVRNRDLTEALEQQTATGEILSVINRSPTDVHPVFEAIADAALKLCRGSLANVFRFDGERLHLEVVKNVHDDPDYFAAIHSAFPRPLGRETAGGRAVLARDVVEIPDILQDPEYGIRTQVLTGGFRSVLAVPLMLGNKALGSIAISRSEPEPFPRSQVALLQTFADQAVIAIENVRLFKEVEARNRELTEALEQQTATSEVLKVISKSAFDLQPVLETVIENAVRVCGAEHGHVHRFDGEYLRLAAGYSANAELLDYLRRHPNALDPGTLAGQAGIERRPIHCHDVLTIPNYARSDAQRLAGFRTILAVPILSAEALLGVIMIWKTRVEPFTDKQIDLVSAFADQAAIAIENVRLFKELEARNRDLTEALEQQTATSEILRVISRSPTDVQPVFDTIALAALKLCRASSALVTTYDGRLIHVAADANLTPEGADAWRRVFPRPASRDTALARAVLTRQLAIIPDVLQDKEYMVGDTAVGTGFRSSLAVPLLRDGNPIGAIGVGRPEPGTFPQKQIALLQTFADQAVIAIENVRLFTELEGRNRDLTEALEHQTATSEILQVISSSPTDVQPVFDIIGARAEKLCEAQVSIVTRVEGQKIHLAAVHGVNPEATEPIRRYMPADVSAGSASARAFRERSLVHIADVLADSEYDAKEIALAGGWRSCLAVPMLREGQVIGTIFVGRSRTDLFPPSKVQLLKTFADQAVIAVENVRLFKELEARNYDLSEALEQQTATSEILRVISQSPTDVQPVFDTIADAAMQLCGGNFATVVRFDGELVHIVALASTWKVEEADAIRRVYPMRPSRETIASRAVLSRDVVNIPDVQEDAEYAIRDVARSAGYRSAVGVPLMLHGAPIGAIGVGRPQPGPFPEKQIALLKTFADQAVIAIENVRLFNETKEALERQTATSEVLEAISSAQTDASPVFQTIARNAHRLSGAVRCNVLRYDGRLLHIAACCGFSPDDEQQLRKRYPVEPGDASVMSGRVILSGRVEQIDDVLQDRSYDQDHAVTLGLRRMLGVPMLRGGAVLGVIVLAWRESGQTPAALVGLLKTFADQAVIAIENVRLFNELKARTAELTRSVGELKALGEVGRAVSSTLDLDTVLRTIVSRATQLAGVDGGSIYEYDAAREEFHVRATDRLPDDLVEAMRATPIRKGEGLLGRMAITREPVEVPDIADTRAYQSRVRGKLVKLGYRSLLAVPLLREDQLLGGLAVNRERAGDFAPEVVELLKTFASQSALAIQNARLFREIEVKSRELETASRHKSEFLANMSHELRTPLNAIIGFSEVLAERMFGEINDKQAEYLSDILESGRHLLSLINDILDLSKIEAGRMELEAAEFDLPGAIENTLILVRERAQRREIRLGRTLDERLGKIHADERKVKQVLLNLLSNALKFTPEGGRIEVKAALHDGVAEISVTDTGVGIAPQDQEAVFEEFRQVGTASKKSEGTGLGLAISRKFVELHGGRMWVESEVGKGSKFVFTLPHTPQVQAMEPAP